MLHNMKGQFAEHLMRVGFVSSKDPKDPKANVNSGRWRPARPWEHNRSYS